jgi:hypothetical protein
MMERAQRRRRSDRPGSSTGRKQPAAAGQSTSLRRMRIWECRPAVAKNFHGHRSTSRSPLHATRSKRTSDLYRLANRSRASQPSSGRKIDFKPCSEPIPGMDWVPVHVESLMSRRCSQRNAKWARWSSLDCCSLDQKATAAIRETAAAVVNSHGSTVSREVRIYIRRRCRGIPATTPHFQQCRVAIACKKEVGQQRAVAAALFDWHLLTPSRVAGMTLCLYNLLGASTGKWPVLQ